MLVAHIEELIEDEYRTIALSPELRDSIETLILEDFDSLQAVAEKDRARLDAQRIQLTAQRQKLLDAHYAGAIPLDLLKTEQERIVGQLSRIEGSLAAANAGFEEARSLLAETLDLTRDCHAAYLESSEANRRLFNQAFFTKIYIDEDDGTRRRSVRVDYNQPFDDMLSRLVPARAHHDLDQKQTAHQALGGSVLAVCNEPGQSSHTGYLELLAGSLSNSGRSPLLRALAAYRTLDLTGVVHRRPHMRSVRQAKFLTVSERARLVERYESGALVKDLALEFGIDRRTVSHHLRQAGVPSRPYPPSEDQIGEMVRLYESGLPLAAVGERVGFSPFIVQRYLRERGVSIRPTTRRKKQ